ncbi:ABC transporter substrate-binding protein [Kiloniella sp. b19]|uniref:ABC transporter substrate-binding protein n=1 Tax=Kiloniella sp. GXU_MW_B19 TaxID=3141326 RepID=UPI0031CF8960
MKLLSSITFAVFAFCMAAALAARAGQGEPERARGGIVSINLCTDQLLLMLGDPAEIRSVSFLARDRSISAYWEEAQNHDVNHGLIEQILPMEPDLVLAGRYTSRYTVALLEEQGKNVLVLDPARSLEDMIANIQKVADAIGRPLRGRQIIEAILERPKPDSLDRRVILYGASGTTAGPPSLGDTAIAEAGLKNVADELGIGSWGYLSVEGLLRSDPDLIVFQRSGKAMPAMATQLLHHPALTASRLPALRMDLTRSELICATPRLFETSRAIRKRIEREE